MANERNTEQLTLKAFEVVLGKMTDTNFLRKSSQTNLPL